VALGIQLADVNLAKSVCKALKQYVGLGHGRVPLLSVGQIQADSGFRQYLEPARQFFRASPVALSPVHVFYYKPFSERNPNACVMNRVWMQNHLPVGWGLRQELDNLRFLRGTERARSVEGNVVELG